jgi:hypothetical protein
MNMKRGKTTPEIKSTMIKSPFIRNAKRENFLKKEKR